MTPDRPPLRDLNSEATVKLAEYSHAQDMLKHYDIITWQIGSIVMGANAVLIGLVGTLVVKLDWLGMLVAAATAVFTWVPLEAWYQTFTRHRSLYNLRNETLHRLEIQLGMYHFLRAAEAGSDDENFRASGILDLDAARTRAYVSPDGTPFSPLWPGLGLDGISSHKMVAKLRYGMPAAVFILLACLVVATNA
ncbi:MAG TPA: hypothetical protein VGN27_14690 [Gaiellaceae bacterium]|jgi:hypothetical protein|nr:hypothetical protein [Gaiellaceae bacterium]